MIRTVLFAAALLWPTHALAQSVPPEVMAHYRTYAAEKASDAPDHAKMGESARAAWQAAEKALGDSKLTGDLAVNYAETRHSTVDGKYEPNAREEAYRRAVELANFYPAADRDEVRIQRQILLAQHLLNDRINARGATRRARSVLGDVGEGLAALGWTTSTYGADMHTLLAQSRLIDKSYRKSLEEAALARAAFARADDGLFSVQRYQLPLFEAVAAQELGDDVRAGESLQSLVEDHHREIGRYTGPSAVAYSRWLDLSEDLEGRTDDPAIAKLLQWTPPPAIGENDPAVRQPPIMPPRAVRSGWTQFSFDVQPNGRIDMSTVEVIDESEEVFRKASMESLKLWVYPPGMDEDARTGVTTTITYQLSDERGNLIPVRREAPPLDD